MPDSNIQKTIRFAYGRLLLTFNAYVKKQPSVSKMNRFFLQESGISDLSQSDHCVATDDAVEVAKFWANKIYIITFSQGHEEEKAFFWGDGENRQNDESRPWCAKRERKTVSEFYIPTD